MHPKDAQKLQQTLTQAIQHHQAGSLANAISLYRKALQLQPVNFDALHMLGVAYAAQGDVDKALDSIAKALKINQTSARAHVNYGNALRSAGRLKEALASHEKALQFLPTLIDAWHNKGNVLAEMGRNKEAVLTYDAALALDPDQPKILNDKAASLLELGEPEDAMICCRRALEIQPDHFDAFYNLGMAFKYLKQYSDALLAFNTIIETQPEYADAYWNRGLVLEQMNRITEAHQDFDQAIKKSPETPFRQGISFHSKRKYCVWKNHQMEWQALLNLLDQGKKAGEPFGLMASPAHPKHLKMSAEQWFSSTKDIQSRIQHRVFLPKKHNKLRIAYFSSDFRLHPVSILAAQMFESHNRDLFETYAFSILPDAKNDLMRTRLEKAFDHFIDVGKLTDSEIADLALQHELDIAIDLNGITSDCRLGIFACRIAPIQAGYLGFPGTVSADLLDYLIADPYVIPDGFEKYYGEKIVRLPHTYMVNDTTREITQGKHTRKDFNLPEDGFVFCSFNNSFKISPEVFDIWMWLLQQVPESVLWLPEGKPLTRENLRREAEIRGISADRLVFAPLMENISDHLGRLSLANLFLDCFDYNAHTTTIDALWAGLPVLTCPTESFSGRVAGSILNAVGLPELIATSKEEYGEIALALARSPEKLFDIRHKLAKNKETYPLFKTDLFARHLEDAFLSMWSRHEQGLPPDHIWVKSRQNFPALT